MSKKNGETRQIKIILLGESGVGKTCIINRYFENKFSADTESTLGSYSTTKTIVKNKIKYIVDIWDTTGQEKYHSITNLYIKGSNIVILVYSIDSKSTFDKLNYWYDSVKDKIEGDDYVLAVVGSKYDLFESEEVPDEEAKKYAEEKNAIFQLVSAKSNNEGVTKLFDTLIDEFINRYNNKERRGNHLTVSEAGKHKKKIC